MVTVTYKDENGLPKTEFYDGTLANCRSAINSLKAKVWELGLAEDGFTIVDEDKNVTTENDKTEEPNKQTEQPK
jgi:hypothetical protein